VSKSWRVSCSMAGGLHRHAWSGVACVASGHLPLVSPPRLRYCRTGRAPNVSISPLAKGARSSYDKSGSRTSRRQHYLTMQGFHGVSVQRDETYRGSR